VKTRLFTRRTTTTTAEPRSVRSRRPAEPERGKSNLREFAADLFSALFAFRAAPADARPSYRAFRQEMVNLLGEFERRAERDRADEKGDTHFALVALVDEIAMNTEWAGAAEWARDTLQMDYFHKETAGDEFFERLNDLQTHGDPDVLEIYYLCLCAGFRGCHQGDPGTVQSIRNRLVQRLPLFDLRHESHLTDDAYGRQLERPLVTRRFPFFWALPFALGAIGLWLAYSIVLNRQVDEIRQLPAAGAAPIGNTK
jgi:type IV/VI secretion system ImpK/VasF family protein